MDAIYKPGDKVDLVIIRKTDLGYVAEINETDEGLIYYDSVFEDLEFEQELTGYIKLVRPDGGIDLQLQKFGNLGSDELGERILAALKENNGFIPLNAKSPSKEVYDYFAVSRNKFKMAIGHLYKKRLVAFTDEGTELVSAVK